MGNGSKGAGKDRRNYACPGIDVQGGGAVGDIVWQKDLGDDGGYTEGPGGVPPLGGATDHGDDGNT